MKKITLRFKDVPHLLELTIEFNTEARFRNTVIPFYHAVGKMYGDSGVGVCFDYSGELCNGFSDRRISEEVGRLIFQFRIHLERTKGIPVSFDHTQTEDSGLWQT